MATQRTPGAGEGGGPQVVLVGASNARYRLDVYVQVFNPLNRTNLTRFVGNQRSPYFGRAISAAPPRRIEFGASLSF